MTRIPLVPMLIAVVTVFFVIHYLFASITAQTTALLPVFLLAVLSVPGVPARAITLILVYSLGNGRPYSLRQWACANLV